MFGCIDNFITFGHGTIATNPEYRHMLIDMFTIVMTSPALGADDRVTACKLGEGILLHLRGQIDDVSMATHRQTYYLLLISFIIPFRLSLQ